MIKIIKKNDDEIILGDNVTFNMSIIENKTKNISLIAKDNIKDSNLEMLSENINNVKILQIINNNNIVKFFNIETSKIQYMLNTDSQNIKETIIIIV